MYDSILAQRDRLGVKPGQIYIDGKWSSGNADGTMAHIHPATNQEVTSIVDATVDDVDRAVLAARKAYDQGPWRHMGASERKRLLQPFVDKLNENTEELAYLQTLDNGIPINFSLNTRVSARNAADIFDHYMGWIDKITGQVFPQYTDSANLQYLTLREPVGVCGLIIPWNAPLMMWAMKVAPALASGCTMVMKPAETASLCALRMSELLEEIDLPPGVFNIVTGGPSVGQSLVTHPGIDKVSFTGSPVVGEYILSQAGSNMKRTTLELGGKSAALVFPDAASVDTAARTVMGLCSTFLSGQVCSTTTRAVVHESVYDEFLASAQAQLEGVKYGDPFDMTTTSAPIISKKQTERIMQYIQIGQDEGARLVVGGDRPTEGELADGNWINPTIFADVDNKMKIAQDEIFGPVLSVIPFKTDEEAIAIANDSDYGLSGAVYTTNLGKAFRISKAMHTGSVGINGYSVMPNSPSGGVKRSGLGREGGWSTIEAFTEEKTLILNLDVE